MLNNEQQCGWRCPRCDGPAIGMHREGFYIITCISDECKFSERFTSDREATLAWRYGNEDV